MAKKNKKQSVISSSFRVKINTIYMMIGSIGVLLSMYLWNVHLTGNKVFCGTGGCDEVLTGEFSEIAGVPVAAMGFAFYVAFIVISFQRSKINHQLLDKMIYLLIISGILFTIYLRYIEFAEIGDICMWCWGSVVIVSLLAILMLYEYRSVNK
jgi:uncharacterized membrane protein